jgi:flagellar hook-basal body complex protein FliE
LPRPRELLLKGRSRKEGRVVDGVSAVATSASQTAVLEAFSSRVGSERAPIGATPFSTLLTDAVAGVDALENQAHAAVTGLMTGSGVDVHQAMITTQKADMAFELALSVRNKAVQAYQSVMGMQF